MTPSQASDTSSTDQPGRLRDTRDAFDSVSGDYDGDRGNNELIREMRAEMWRWLDKTFPVPSRLIDLGCGTGLDAIRLAHAHELARLDGDGTYDGAYSNLGPLNCVPDLAAVARDCARLLRPGGSLVFTVIGRVCPWELAHFRGLCVFVPPPYLTWLRDRHPAWHARLWSVDRRVAGWPGLRGLGDHFLIVMKKRGAGTT